MSLETGVATRPNGAPPPEIPLAEVQLESLDFWVRNDDVRDAAFATLRREAPISFWPAIQLEGFETGQGYWALTKLDDVHFASRHPDIFSSAGGITINDQTPELAEYFGSMIVLIMLGTINIRMAEMRERRQGTLPLVDPNLRSRK